MIYPPVFYFECRFPKRIPVADVTRDRYGSVVLDVFRRLEVERTTNNFISFSSDFVMTYEIAVITSYTRDITYKLL